MNLKNKIHKKFLLLIFCTITLVLILENPSISQINILYGYVSISETQSQFQDGLFYQGSSVIVQNTITYINQTTKEPLVYEIQFNILNFGSLFICFIPIIVYMYYDSDNNSKKIDNSSKKIVKKKRLDK